MAITMKSVLAPSLDRVDAILDQHHRDQGSLMAILREVQNELGYLPEEALARIALGLDLPLSKVYGLATFYTLFSTKPKGEFIIRVCESAPCHVEGAQEVIEALEQELGIKVGENTPDGKFTLELSSCLGICGVAPAIMVNDEVYGNLTPEMIPGIISKYREAPTARATAEDSNPGRPSKSGGDSGHRGEKGGR